MSTKKENPSAKESKGQDKNIEARLEAGRQELMKVIEGVPGAEKLNELIERGKKKGKLSAGELMEVLEEMDLESEQMDKIYDTLENLGIETVGEDYLPEPLDDAVPPVEELEEIPEEEIVDPNTLVDSFGIDDPVRMYLKEIGKVNLLTSEEEVELAQAMGEGAMAKQQLEDPDAQLDILAEKVMAQQNAGSLEEENTDLKARLKAFEDKEAADKEATRKALLDAAEADGRINAEMRPVYENILKSNPEEGEKALKALAPKRKVMEDLKVDPGDESPWSKRMKEINNKLNKQ